MNIYIREMKDKIKSTIVWSISIFLLILLFMSVFPAFSGDAEMLNLVMENYPEELLKAFGMSGVDLGSVAGYFTMALLFVQICLAVQASNLGFSILSEEERELTADFLLTKPVRRSKVFISKVLAAVTSLTIVNAITWGSTFLFVEMFKDGKEYDTAIFVKMLATIVLFQLFFLGVGLIISVLVKKIKSVLTYSMSLSFGMYIISAFSGIVGEKTLSYITPFKYFEPNSLIINGEYEGKYILICVAIIAISFVASFILYCRRDIHSAN